MNFQPSLISGFSVSKFDIFILPMSSENVEKDLISDSPSQVIRCRCFRLLSL